MVLILSLAEDLRQYWGLMPGIIFQYCVIQLIALRAAGASSFGNSRMLYFIGDTDGSFSQDFNNSIPIPGDRNFSFMAHAPNLRGFSRNIRNGNSFSVVNTELRMPIAKYFSRKEIKSPFLQKYPTNWIF